MDNNSAGAVWVYTRSGGVWSQQGSKLVGAGAIGAAWQGGSVSISADGATTIVGGPFDNSRAGAAWVFISDSCHVDSSSIARVICQGDTFVFGAQFLTSSGIYTNILSNVSGCDSIVTLTLTVNPISTSSISNTICQGDSFTFGGHSLSAAGIYTDTLAAVNTCDSIVTLHLTVTQSALTTLHDTITQGHSVTVGSHTYTQSGSYTDTLAAASGCDSIVSLTLTVGPNGIAQTPGQSSIHLYPNPNSGSFTLSIINYQLKTTRSPICWGMS